MKQFGLILLIFSIAFISKAQTVNCVLRPPQLTIHFGAGDISDINNEGLSNYRRVFTTCPSDGYYSFASFTSSCFRDDWHTLEEDHTAGDVEGNMLLINAARNPGPFLRTPITGLKGNTIYELGFWLMNLCKPTKKCPSVLLPSLVIQLETPEGKIVAKIVTGDIPRVVDPHWTQHRARFTTPASASKLVLVMIDNIPSGCGNDFAVDDITFRECVMQTAQAAVTPRPVTTKQPTVSKTPPKKVTVPSQKKLETAQLIKLKKDTVSKEISVVNKPQKIFSPAPLVLKTRDNALVRRLETDAGEIKMDIYDNGQIDGDTVSIYHNNELIRSKMRLSHKPISVIINIDPSQSHHEIIMVAENLGTIPPNTSIMIITTGNKRYELNISSSEQKNAKIVFDLKK